ncbi:hypothetical protein J5N97_019763 [Dioscorea zingiberensis]|uniref:Uncharacterized protein n=1 Tax=Dioscorea zingiberensis TaxID=325984 RepID=A0A9D5CFA4_9LILI|nr:hypothetical protein J5N97_019763 [Dioscorea zingiberensis]
MAAFRLLVRARISSRSISQATIPSSQISSPTKRCVSRIPRVPLDSCCPVSMLPLHSAVASARLKSVLAAESQSWGWVPQGLSMPL